MAKQKSHSPSIATRHWNQNNYGGLGQLGEYLRGTVQERIGGKDISVKVDSNAERDSNGSNWRRADNGFGPERSRGTRPVHRAKNVGKNWGGWGK